MPVIVSTTSVTLDIHSLFPHSEEGKAAAAREALTGKFTQKLVSTPDYTISLLTYVDCYLEGCPINGAEYEVELIKTEKKRTFISVSEMLEFIDAYVTSLHEMARVEFSLKGLQNDEYVISRPSAFGRKNVTLRDLNVIIREVDDVDAERMTGFVKLDKVARLKSLWNELQAKLI